MDDLLRSDLAALAPWVDGPAARAAFDRRRRSLRHRRRVAATGAAAVVLVALAGVGIGSLAGDDHGRDGRREVVVASGASADTFEVLEVRDALETSSTLRSAIDSQQLAQLWHDIGFNDEPPSVDFDERVIVSITIADDCVPELRRLDREGDVLTPVFVDGGCARPPIVNTYVVAIDRAWVAPEFTLRLPANERLEFGEQRMTVETND
jgi:hypothetical protein